jgi:methylsterol monooxygenase
MIVNTTAAINSVSLLAAARDVLDTWWGAIYYRHTEWFLLSLVSALYAYTIYYGLGLFFLFIDLTKWPEWFYEYKIQKTPLDKRTLRKMIIVVALVTLGMTGPCFYLVAYISAHSDRWGVRVERELPPVEEIVRDFIAFGVIEEVIFYYSHRLMHVPFLYKRIHKLHHEFKSPVALAAGYAHPIEELISNLLPLFLPAVVMNSHIVTYWLIVTVGIVTTLYDHSGYAIPWIPLGIHPFFHDYHHESFRYNFGVLGLLDWFHGTWKVRGDFDPKRLTDPKFED